MEIGFYMPTSVIFTHLGRQNNNVARKQSLKIVNFDLWPIKLVNRGR